MKKLKFLTFVCASLAVAGCAQSSTDPAMVVAPDNEKSIVLAGGCFWCVEADFDKLDGVTQTISGYAGGTLANPTYKQVSHGGTGHYEVVEVRYNADKLDLETLLDYYWRHVDPTDAGGQFCDRGDSYKTAIFVKTPEERAVAEASKQLLEDSEQHADPIVTPILDYEAFWPAEEYHQDYYVKNPIRYRYYRNGCGRDSRIKELWGGRS